jgi:ATP-dependent Clp protease ATP-binding subunit ClpA
LINQNSAVNLIAKSLRSRTLGLSKEDRPIGSFLFLGPTVVGKTETAKVLAKVYYGSTEAILRFDMAQYSGGDAIDRLIGSVTTGRQGDLSIAIKNRPASLLLLDEIEKASKEVLNLLLTILDEGYLVDAFGRRINCQHLFIIGTSNAAAEYIRELVQAKTSSGDLQKKVVEYTLHQGLFFPEFLNRFDGVVVYEPLSEENLFKVARMMLFSFGQKLQTKGVALSIDDDLVKQVVRDGYDPAFGARPMRRVVDMELGELLGRAILLSQIKEGDNVKIVYENGNYKTFVIK